MVCPELQDITGLPPLPGGLVVRSPVCDGHGCETHRCKTHRRTQKYRCLANGLCAEAKEQWGLVPSVFPSVPPLNCHHMKVKRIQCGISTTKTFAPHDAQGKGGKSYSRQSYVRQKRGHLHSALKARPQQLLHLLTNMHRIRTALEGAQARKATSSETTRSGGSTT